ncbi:MAG: hypothetical protein WDN72_06875 [Alphaproteobacteria bacterium]
MARTREKRENARARAPRRRLRIMPLTLTMLGLLFALKVGDVYFDTRALHEALSVREASAADTAPPAPAPAVDASKPADAAAAPAAAATGNTTATTAAAPAPDAKSGDKAAKPEMTLGTGKTPVSKIEELKAKENVSPYTQDEVDLLQNLTKRRQELDAREQDLEMKGKVLDATEKRIDDKIAAMKSLQVDLGKVVAEYNKQEDKEIDSLVKIYQNMKPSDAATVFNQLDMPILLKIIDKMSERKVAPILAGMDPKRARDVTEELAEMRRNSSATADAAATQAGPATAKP